MIQTFADKRTAALFKGLQVKQVGPDIAARAHRKLLLLDATTRLEDLRVPPGNRLEELRGDRKGQHSIRVNDQWRVCFRWDNGDVYDVEFTDYH